MSTNFRLKPKDEKGVVLLLTFVIMTALMIIVLAYIAMTHSEVKTVGGQVSNNEAFFVAEAGVPYAIYRLKTNPDWNENGSVTHLIGRGSFVVDARTIPGGAPPTVYKRITSTGTVEGLSRLIKQDVVVTP